MPLTTWKNVQHSAQSGEPEVTLISYVLTILLAPKTLWGSFDTANQWNHATSQAQPRVRTNGHRCMGPALHFLMANKSGLQGGRAVEPVATTQVSAESDLCAVVTTAREVIMPLIIAAQLGARQNQ